jgi:hypothetical protein
METARGLANTTGAAAKFTFVINEQSVLPGLNILCVRNTLASSSHVNSPVSAVWLVGLDCGHSLCGYFGDMELC